MWHKATRRPPLAIGTARTNDDKERERKEKRERESERDYTVLAGIARRLDACLGTDRFLYANRPPVHYC